MSRWQLKVRAGDSNGLCDLLVFKDSRPKCVDKCWNFFVPRGSAKRLLCFQDTRRRRTHNAGGSLGSD